MGSNQLQTNGSSADLSATYWLLLLSISLAKVFLGRLARWPSGSLAAAADPGEDWVRAPLPPDPDAACVSSPTGGTKGESPKEGSRKIHNRNPGMGVKKDPRFQEGNSKLQDTGLLDYLRSSHGQGLTITRYPNLPGFFFTTRTLPGKFV